MQYRPLGDTGVQVSAISLGTEYLINRPAEHVAGVVHAAIDGGINYFDLFFAQPAFRDNMGAAFRGRREKVMLAGHLGAIEVDGQSDKTRDPAAAEPWFHDFLRRYHTDYVDVLYLHNIDTQEDYDRVMAPGGLADMADRFRREGKARFIGFSGHTVSTSRQAVESGRINVLMFPVNMAGHAISGRRELLLTCGDRGVGLIAMKPYAGGKLLRRESKMLLERSQRGDAAAEVHRPMPITAQQCLAYVQSLPGVSAVLPGCKDLPELEVALGIFGATPEEKDFGPALAGFAEYAVGECVYCNHCLPCPSAIDIGGTIRLLEIADGRADAGQRAAYAALPAPASACIQCGDCEARCPFGVEATGKMEQAATLFEGS